MLICRTPAAALSKGLLAHRRPLSVRKSHRKRVSVCKFARSRATKKMKQKDAFANGVSAPRQTLFSHLTRADEDDSHTDDSAVFHERRTSTSASHMEQDTNDASFSAKNSNTLRRSSGVSRATLQFDGNAQLQEVRFKVAFVHTPVLLTLLRFPDVLKCALWHIRLCQKERTNKRLLAHVTDTSSIWFGFTHSAANCDARLANWRQSAG